VGHRDTEDTDFQKFFLEPPSWEKLLKTGVPGVPVSLTLYIYNYIKNDELNIYYYI
jgi:hypothetical protein